MQITHQKRNVDTMGIQGARRFEMAQTSHMMQILTSQYSNIPGSIVREYASNMIDGYTKLDKSKPFIKPRLHLPNTIEPYIEFMDFGCGMSYETVWEVFPKMGASTKQSNNDEIGGFGLGAKTAFAYKSAEQWTVESRYEEKKMIFNAHWGEDNWPQFVHVVTVDTQEPNGVTVRIPVNPKDFDLFRNEARQFLEFFPLEIEVTGVDNTFVIKKSEYILEGEDWKIEKGNNLNRLVVGPVTYPIDTHTLLGRSINYYSYGGSNSFIDQLLSKNSVTLFVPIGSVDIIPNREALMFTDRTKSKILSMFDKIVADAEKMAERDLLTVKTEWEALVKVNNLWNITALQHALSKVTWNGKILNPRKGLEVSKEVLSKKDKNVGFYHIGNQSGRSTVYADQILNDSNLSLITLMPSENTRIYLDDLSRGGQTRSIAFLRNLMDGKNTAHSRTHTGKRRKYYTNETYSLYLIKSNVLTTDEISKLWGGIPIEITSSLPKPITAKRQKGINLGKWTKDQYYNRWEECLADTTKKAYFVRKNRNRFEDITDVAAAIKTAISLKILDEKIPIYCIPRTFAHLEKTAKWENLRDVIDKVINEKVKNLDSRIFLRNAWETYSLNTSYSDSREAIPMLIKNFKKGDFKEGTLAYEILSDAKQELDTETQNILSMATMMNISLKPESLSYDIKLKATEFIQKSPMLNVCYGVHLTDKNKQIIINYINGTL